MIIKQTVTWQKLVQLLNFVHGAEGRINGGEILELPGWATQSPGAENRYNCSTAIADIKKVTPCGDNYNVTVELYDNFTVVHSTGHLDTAKKLKLPSHLLDKLLDILR